MSKEIKDFIEISRETLLDGAADFNRNVVKEIKKPITREALKDSVEAIERAAFMIANDGLDPKTGAVKTVADIDEALKTVSDSAGIGSTAILTQQVLTRSLQMLEQPQAIHSMFSTPMTFKTGTQIVIPYIGEATGARDIGPGQELPMLSLDRDAEMISATGRSGIGLTLPDETMRNSNYPILSLYLSKANQALARWKDDKAVRTLLAEATVLFDNADPDNSVYGTTSGRAIVDSKLNGTFTLRDLHKMYQHGVQEGYVFDTLLMSQWGYLLFMYEPVLRQFMEFNNGVLFTSPNGTVGNRMRNEAAVRSRETTPGHAHNKLTPNMDLPSELSNTNFKVIVTNYMPTYFEGNTLMKKLERSIGSYDETYKFSSGNWDKCVENVVVAAGTHPEADPGAVDMHCGVNPMTDLVMCDSQNALLYLEEEKPKVDRKYDNLYEHLEIYIRERYTFVVLEKGRAIVSARNLVITEDTYDFQYRAINTATEMKNAMTEGV